MDIEVKENIKKTSFSKKSFFCVVVSLIGILGFFLVFNRAYFSSGMSQVLGLSEENIVVYNTFTISFSNTVDLSFREEIMDILNEISFNETKRFQLVDSEGDIQIGNVQEEIKSSLILSDSYLVPVGHMYWIESDFTSEDGMKVYVTDDGDMNYLSSLTEYSPVVVDDLLEELEASEDTVAFIPIQNLTFDYKLLNLDEKYFLDDVEGGIEGY